MGPVLDQWVREGVRAIATFVPWQAAEADISHLLPRFLTEAIERKIHVSLILTPEPGINYPNGGVPKPLMQKAEHVARDGREQGFPQALPPGFYDLASLSSQELLKRWHGTLGRVDAILGDLEKAHPSAGQLVQTVVTGSFWKYYRSPEQAAVEPFSGECVDLGPSARIQIRNRLEQTLATREFLDTTSGSAQESMNWKSRHLEAAHRRWIAQQSEEVFRNRAAQVLGRRSRGISSVQVDMISPEADPSLFYTSVLQSSGIEGRDFAGLSRTLDAHLDRMAAGGTEVSGEAAPWVHWSGLGAFAPLPDSEKQFLILKSLLNAGTRGGCVLVDESEWSLLSAAFRSRSDAMAWTLGAGDLQLREKVLYLTPHLWSESGSAWKTLKSQLGREARLVSSLDLALSRPGVKMLWVDPMWIFNREAMMRLLEWSGDGRVLVLPKSAVSTGPARRMLDDAMRGSSARAIRITQGVPCDIHPAGTGKVIFAEMRESAALHGKALPQFGDSELKAFVEGVLNLAELQPSCRVTDVRIDLIPSRRVDSGMGLFVLNGHNRAVQADLQFQEPVLVSDFSSVLTQGGAPSRKGGEPDRPEIAPASHFSLEVPPRGVLPIAVFGSGPDWEASAEVDAPLSEECLAADSLVQVWAEERRVKREVNVAAEAAPELAREADFAALSELHGLSDSGPSAEMPF